MDKEIDSVISLMDFKLNPNNTAIQNEYIVFLVSHKNYKYDDLIGSYGKYIEKKKT